MKQLKFLIAGILFGIVLTKSEAISWYRIQEMFRFQGFQMYGIFITAIPTGILCLWLIRKFRIRTIQGEPILVAPIRFTWGIPLGGFIFGLGWALTGACPGPLFAQIGTGFTVVAATLFSALAGTWVCTALQNRLPR
ncbi:MAG TPA: YeeE/YedE thiosulfate transporter family protein [Chitinophagaceae bacterium]|nr:YeeE/YedE thiosulfate transporter family protein [Chitinophagaceae bacterium]